MDFQSFLDYFRGRQNQPTDIELDPQAHYYYAPPQMIPALLRATQGIVDPVLMDSLVQKETGWNPNARGSKGEYGLTQLMPATAKQYGLTKDMYAVEPNLRVGATFLQSLLKKYHGDTARALAAYNAGARGERLGRSKDYAQDVLRLMEGNRGK